jgi:hypothetical protein
MMTVSAIMAGLLPTLWSTGTGSEVMRRIAVPMVGGMVSSTILTLLVIPAIYAIAKGWQPQRTTTTARSTERWPVPSPPSKGELAMMDHMRDDDVGHGPLGASRNHRSRLGWCGAGEISLLHQQVNFLEVRRETRPAAAGIGRACREGLA